MRRANKDSKKTAETAPAKGFRTKMITFVVRPEEHARLRALAESRDESVGATVRRCIRAEWAREEAKRAS